MAGAMRSGTFGSGLSPFGTGTLPPYQGSPTTTPITPPGTTPPRPGPAPGRGGHPGHGGIPTVKQVPVRGVPKPGTAKPKARPGKGVQATGTAYKTGASASGNAIAQPKPIPTLGKVRGIGWKSLL